MNHDYRINWPLPDEFLVELGRVTALWASLESLLNTCLGKLAGFDVLTDPTPFILVNHSSFPQRLDMLGALCEELKDSEPHLAGHKDVVSKLKSAQATRNRFSHNGISFDPASQGHFLAQGSARGKVKTTVSSITSAEIHLAAREIHLATLALYKLVLKREVPPMWDAKRNQESGGA
jgi:hypothetical protein